jgi:hypothetical protein
LRLRTGKHPLAIVDAPPIVSNRAFVTLRRLGVTEEPVDRMGRPSGPRWRGPDVD